MKSKKRGEVCFWCSTALESKKCIKCNIKELYFDVNWVIYYDYNSSHYVLYSLLNNTKLYISAHVLSTMDKHSLVEENPDYTEAIRKLFYLIFDTFEIYTL
ncbi:MAG: hypothetical protein GF317_23350 [Candidatus Lokiarchaeota archaeon]|nr:hypothetical protein [Candidatus Lokiarchaeota archaeon]